MYGDFLSASGFCVVSTANADEGFDLAVQFGAAVVVADYWLGGSRPGGDLCNRLTHDDRTRHMPTLLVTASSLRKQVEAISSRSGAEPETTIRPAPRPP